MRESVKWTDREERLLKEFYEDSTKEELINMFPNRTYLAVRQKARKLGLKRDGRIKHKVNSDFFTTESPDLFYVIGLWAADGYINNVGRLSYHTTDKELIQELINMIGYEGKLYINDNYSKVNPEYKTSTSYAIYFYNEEALRVMEKYGIYYLKSLTMKFPNNIPREYLKDYIRGVFDGDGSITISDTINRGKPHKVYSLVFTCGSKDFLEGLKQALETHVSDTQRKIQEAPSCFRYTISSKYDIAKFGEWIYGDGGFGMSRKKDRILDILETTKGSVA